jgi:hypothetical protein
VSAIFSTNRTQRLVLGFFLAVWVALVAILLIAPQIYNNTLMVGSGADALASLALLLAISVLVGILAVGVVRRWRWTFWLILVAFLFGLVRVIATALQAVNLLPAGGPAWYLVFQAIIGAVQFLIALEMIAGYRKAGVWGAF